MRRTFEAKALVLSLLTVPLLGASITGCNLFGGGLLLPFGQISVVQLPDDPQYTVALSVAGAVADPSSVAKVRWVFGDGSGIVDGDAGRTEIVYQYAATGNYIVSAQIFDGIGFVGQIDGTVTVLDIGTPTPPPPVVPPGEISGPNPVDGAENVPADTMLTWTGGANATSHDVYLGEDEDAVRNAFEISAEFKGNQTGTDFDPTLNPDTEYYWRVDALNASGIATGQVMRFRTASAPGKATDPVPAHEMTTARVDVVLQWTAGDGATSHDVYFGTDEAAVKAADNTSPEFQGNQTGTTFDPEDAAAAIPGQLQPNTTYYWRIDEVGLGGTTTGGTTTDAPWSFTTAAPPPKVTNPIPGDTEMDVNVDQSLNWSAVPGVESFDVYFGIDETGVGNATRSSPEFMGNQTAKSYDPGTMPGGTTHFWRIDTLGPGGTTTGDVFRFTTADPPPQATGFDPADNATNVPVDKVLSWAVGAGGGTTDSFDVYFGTDQTAVANGSASAFQGNQIAGDTTFDPASVNPDTEYFWRIDAVGPGGKLEGPALRFRTGSLSDPAEDPDPANGELGVPLDKLLDWTAGSGATGHDVYFGTDQNAVINADTNDAEFKVHIDDPAGDPLVTMYDPATLDGNTTYFWRIDETAPGGVTTGSVWQFTTAPAKATVPTPEHDATGVALEPTLGWTAGDGAVTHDVYFSSVEADVISGAAFEGNQGGTTFDPGTLDGGTDHFWRIDEVGTDGTTAGDVWKFTTAAGMAAEPVAPTDGATCQSVDPTLTWNAGAGAVSHDVYFGTNETTVQNATRSSGEFQTNLLLGTETFIPPSPLNGCTDYFWRIDELDADDNVTAGEVWQFRTATGAVTNPDPADLETGAALAAQLSWTAASGATTYDVYFSSVEADVISGAASMGNQAATTFDPGPLTGNTTYYWRIDPVGCGCTTAGDVWEFTTRAGAAAAPVTPADGATCQSVDPTLTWNAGAGAVSHDVYFGTNETAVQSATRSSGEYQVNLLLGTEAFTPAGPLDGCTDYYWRIDELDADDNVTAGEVWQFRTATAQASDPVPDDLTLGVDVNAQVSWTAASGAATYDVYFSSVEADVNSGAAFVGNQASTSFDPGPLAGGTTYYWRVDPVGCGCTTAGDVWEFTTGPGQATTPSPADGMPGVGLNPLLSWTPDAGATSHDVYFGTTHTAVDTATRTSPEFKGNQAGTNFSPGSLNGLTFYYWRIDEVNADGTTQGEVWQFLTGPGKATSPLPADFGTDVPLDALLQWTAGIGAVTHDVYGSTNLANVVNGTAFLGNQSGTVFDPGGLPADTTYYWRIDEVLADGTTKTTGDVWRFTTLAPPAQASSPNPFNGATGVAVTAILNWATATGADSYQVYLSTNLADVTNGDPAADQGNQTGTSFNPTPDLAASTLYYWRIDTINSAGTTQGVVWSFTTAP